MLKIKQFGQEVISHPVIYILLGIILVGAFWVRVYRVDQILGFYFDQGRDALVIWDLWHKGKFFLIGPTTGLAGIFRGPYYYYLIAPFYLLGGGDPVWPAVFLTFTTVLAVALIYYLGFKIQGRSTGVIAAILAAFSFYIVIASRWLSNPTPMLLLSLILVWAMFKIAQSTKQKAQRYWPLVTLIAGLSLFNFGSSGELFYILAVIIFALWVRKKLPNTKYLILSAIAFLVTFLPLVVFDLKHEHILLNNFTKTFGQERSFVVPTPHFVSERTKLYYDIFTNKIFQNKSDPEVFALRVIGLAFLIFLPGLWKNKGFKIVLLLLLSAISGLYFYQGNYGVLYDYYMTGYYLIFILLVAIVLGKIWKYRVGKVFVIFFLCLFLSNNVYVIRSKISDGVDGPQSIGFLNQKQAIDWVYKDANGNEFNVDVYVPPVIPYAYDYLFTWYPKTSGLVEERTPLLYTLYEVDGPHPERLDAWLARQKGIGRVEYEQKFGGITVQRRTRIK